MRLDEQTLLAHINGGEFLDGVSRGFWRVVELDWPYVSIAIKALPKDNVADEYILRFECTNYPQTAPAATPWDLEKKTPLAHELWPAGTGPIPSIFNPTWNSNAPNSLYFAMDRMGLKSHPDWVEKFPSTSWSPRKEITHYVQLIHEYLNSANYQGTRQSINGN